MALTLESSINIKKRVAAFPDLPARLAILVNSFLGLLTQMNGDPELQLVPFSLAAAETLTAANVGARVYAVVAFTPISGAFAILTVGTLGSDPLVTLEPANFNDHEEQAVLFPGGAAPPDNTDVTVAADASNDGIIKGFVLLGAPA